jgi:hypothetical protein
VSVINGGHVHESWSGHMDGGLVLDLWNGRPTETLLRTDGQHFLRWLVLGQSEAVDVWLQLELRPGEPEELLYPGPRDLWAFVGDHKESQVQMSLVLEDIGVQASFENPGGPEAVTRLLASFVEWTAVLAREEGPQSAVLRRAIKEIQDFLG